ncbi:MAG TPA: ethanolamine ammonia-lyase subunit EutC [Candidatus Angelobacter sp.]|nr:ethanolamine ammonia-lyase subunit EutC [Candidatus Angelobacter sp.]
MKHDDALKPAWPTVIEKIRARTPARVLVERAGAAYRTETQLELREAHAAARDAVRTEFDLERDLGASTPERTKTARSGDPGAEFVRQWKLFAVSTMARNKDEYLLRPDLGRQLSPEGRKLVEERCGRDADLQIVIGDGLSVTAVRTQVPKLLPLIAEGARARGWAVGQSFAVRYCRVGVMNAIGELLRPKVVVLLIGERPGLATAESLSAYMGFRPTSGHTDASRNLISNIHGRGVPAEAAARRIVALAGQMIERKTSGVELKEDLPGPKWLEEIGRSGDREIG